MLDEDAIVLDIGYMNNWATVQVGADIRLVTLRVDNDGLCICTCPTLTKKQQYQVEVEVNKEPMCPTTSEDPCGGMRRTTMTDHQFYEKVKDLVVNSWALVDEDPVSREEVFENVYGWYEMMHKLQVELAKLKGGEV